MANRSLLRKLEDDVSYAAAFSTTSIDADHMSGTNWQVEWTKNVPSAKAFATTDVDVDDDTITETAHGYKAGLLGQFTTTDTLPAGISLSTDYYVLFVDVDTYQISATQGGSAVNITDVGVGTHTFTPTNTLAGTVDIQGSNDNTTFLDVLDSAGAAIEQTIGDATGAYTFNLSRCNARYYRADFTLTSGQADITVIVNAKGGAS